MRHGNVLISGAGIAGPALAYWLRRHGFTPTIVERATARRHGGQAVDVRGTARDAITRMGIMDEVRAHHTGTHGIAYVDADNRRLAAMRGEDFGHSGGIIAEIEILRADLVRILQDAARDVEYLYGDTITGLADGPDGVDVTFAKAAPRRFDLVVGADGLGSGVRALAFGDDSTTVNDLGYYAAFYTATTDLKLDGWELMYSMPAGNGVRGRLAMLYPIGDTGEARAMFAFAAPNVHVERRDLPAQRALLAQVFHGEGWELPNLLRQLESVDDLHFTRAGEVRLDRWSAGRSVLLGDSAFGGSVGMGTSMALVGAYVLAGELAAAHGDHTVAFAAYEREMRDYVTASQTRPPGGVNGFLPASRMGIRMRNLVMRALPHLPGKEKMMGGIDTAASAIRLKDYGLSVAA
ncbi:MAG TPA: FAD-dependent monooxygenase [Pseudonocardiaceae bacterium]|jgi:2-polyprenyl-6-methoxyphenol hydroxylase-like FAD-dependent oxidoreductase|nr:FAD-dependent monooxygenase [Pseudonocardiaceae bacterium]